MSLFDSIIGESKYILEDDIGEDEEDNDNPDDYNMDDAGTDDDNQQDDNPPEDDQQPEDVNPDDFDMNADQGDENQPDPQQDTPPDDAGEEQPPEDTNPDDFDMNADQGEQNQPDAQQDTPPDDGNAEQTPEGEENQDTNPDDFDMNNAGGEGESDPEGGEGEDIDGDGTEGEEQPPQDDYQEPSSKLRDLEKSIFDQLSPDQKELKIKELKSLYNDVYDKCSKILDIVVAAEKVPAQTKVYDYITNTITDLQKYIRDYLESIFDSRTYIENMTELQKYMAVLDTVNNVFEELKLHNEKQFKDE